MIMDGSELRRIRERMGRLTQAQMAERLGVHRVTLADWERGATGITEPMARFILLLAKTEAEKKPKGRKKKGAR